MKKLKIYFHTNTSGYDDEAVEEEIVEQKNWRGFFIESENSLYSVSAIQPLRHNQEIESSIKEKGVAIADHDEFIVNDVSKETLTNAVPLLIKEGFLKRLSPVSDEEIQKLDLTCVAEINLE